MKLIYIILSICLWVAGALLIDNFNLFLGIAAMIFANNLERELFYGKLD